MYDEIIDSYVRISRKYGLEIEVTLAHDGDKARIDGERILLNVERIPAGEFERCLACQVRKLLLPKLALETDRLTLRRFRPEDARDCFDFLSDRQTCYDDGGYEPYRAMDEEYLRLMARFAEQPLRRMIVLRETGRVIGTVNLFELDDRAVEGYELGYVLSPAHRGQGYATEAVGALCDCLLNDLGADLLFATATEGNAASIRLLERLGFRSEGRRTKGFRHPERGILDLLCYVREREDLK